MNQEQVRKDIARAREEWRINRDGKLSRKRELLAGSGDTAAVRRDRVYREFRKRQRHCAAIIRHLERRLNRTLAREKKES
jgi:hypothetical protein